MSGDDPVELFAAANERRAALTGRAPRPELTASPGRHGQPATTQARWIGRPTASLGPALLLAMWLTPRSSGIRPGCVATT